MGFIAHVSFATHAVYVSELESESFFVCKYVVDQEGEAVCEYDVFSNVEEAHEFMIKPLAQDNWRLEMSE